jgi:hypothetical protein
MFGHSIAYTEADAHQGKLSEGEQNGQEDFEECEEDGSDEALEEFHRQAALRAIFSSDSGSVTQPFELKSSGFGSCCLPRQQLFAVQVRHDSHLQREDKMAKKTLKKAKKMEATKPLTIVR